MNIYVGNLSYEASENDLREAFGAYGEVRSANVIRDRYTGKSRGFGFVEMANNEEAQNAIDGLHNTELVGRNLIVNEARPRGDRGDRGDRGGRPGGGGSKRRW